MTYTPNIDVDALSGIDMHVHISEDDHGHAALPTDLIDAMYSYFKVEQPRLTADELADYYRGLNLAAVVFTVDATTAMNTKPNSSEEIALAAERNNDVFIPFGSVDPLLGVAAIDKARRLVEDYGVRGFKFHPSVQAFEPNDPVYRPLFETLAEYRLPLVFHSGQTGIGAGMRGGYGIKLRYSQPMLIDDLAAEFPDLDFILAHPSVPWQDEAISMATHKANVWIDASGWRPKYFPASLVRAMNSVLQDKILFGSDYSGIMPERWLEDFAALDLKDAVRPKILKANAARLLGFA